MAPKRSAASRQRQSTPLMPCPTSYPVKKESGGMEEAQWIACWEMLNKVYIALDAGRYLAPIFAQLPDKTLYEDYYSAIPEPECLDNVSLQLGSQGYSTPEDFFKQLHLVFLNAKHYNEEDSRIWLDAKMLEDQIHENWRLKASEGIFSHSDPYHFSPRKPRKAKRERGTSSTRASTTPGPIVDPASASVLPLVAEHPSPIPTTPFVEPIATSTVPPPRSSVAWSLTPAMLAQVEADRRIIADLESRLPRWEGPKEVIHGDTAPGGIPGSGWFGEGAPQYEQSVGGPGSWPDRIKRVVHALSEYRDISGRLLVDTLNQVPTLVDIPYLSFNAPISFSSIHTNTQSSRYRTLRAFDLDMVRLFEKSRRWFQGRTQEYGHVLELQRLYNSLTAPFPMNLPPSGVPPPSPTHFASIPAGPGNARFTHELAPDAKSSSEPVGRHFTTFRIGTKDREFTQEARHKGLTYKLGDYVHVMNPDDPSRPIVGQIFKTFVPTKGNRTHHITICWYFRPEQTVHTADRTFHENEIFKTGHFCDHPVEDIIERVSVSFYVKYIRGRPQAPEYYPGWPIYICVARYNDQKQMSVRIKNWASCIPDELRQTDFMTVIPFARQIDPIKVPSPFLRGIKGPGFLGDPQESVGDEDDDEDEGENRRAARVSTREVQKPEQPVIPNIGINVQAGPSRPTQYIPSQPVPTRQVWSTAPTPPSNSTKSFVNLMGGPQVIDHLAVRELLPQETAQLFERDSRGQVLWFSGPPLPLGAIPVPGQPSHSIEYLEYLAKRKRGESGDDGGSKGRKRYTGDVGLSNGPVNSGNEAGVGVGVEEEDLTKIWWAQDQTPGKILDALRSVVDSI